MPPDERARRERRIAMFRQVAAERVARLNRLWIDFERGAGDAQAFLREAHTLKGEASLTGFMVVAKLVHAVEDTMKLVRDRAGPPAAGDGDLILAGLDLTLQLTLRSPDAPSPEGEAFLAQVTAARGAPLMPAPLPTARATSPEGPPAGTSGSPASLAPGEIESGDVAAAAERGSQTEGSIRVTADKIDHLRGMVSDLLLAHERWRQLTRTTRRLRETAERGRPGRPTAEGGSGLETWTGIVAGLSALEARLRDETHDLERFIGELDNTTRELRMIPLASLLDHFPLPLRQLARTLGRQVRFIVAGEQIEVDKALLELLEEPLLHLLRNAVDHGIEPPAARLRAGKPAEATVRIAAGLVGQRLHLQVSDDGAGIDVESIRRRAAASGLLAPATAAQAGEPELLRLMFTAGFSTREQVSEISGRGIGLNIVLDVVENLGGKVEVRTERGHGTAFDIEVPLTVAITRVVLFRVGVGTYALPAGSVRALLDAQSLTRAEGPEGPTVDYAGGPVPLLDLGEVLEEPDVQPPHRRIIIAQSGADLVALAGSSGHREREMLVKPLGKFFERVPLVPAAVSLEDGALALVLKVAELVLLARTRSRRRIGGESTESRAAPGRIALVADDSPVVRDIIAQALRAHGLHVLVAGDGEEALAVFGAHARVDVVVTDLDMPRLDGLALVRALRSRPDTQHVPVVAISMRGGDMDREAALAAGVSAYIDKGDFDQALLWRTVGPLVAGS
jgi:chemotaxis protein histidine kinase CheA/CheY-like chemotaxis protein